VKVLTVKKSYFHHLYLEPKSNEINVERRRDRRGRKGHRDLCTKANIKTEVY
jgi:hypothetical protein